MDLRPCIEKFANRLAEVESALSDPAAFGNKTRAQELSREYSQLKELAALGAAYTKTLADLEANRGLEVSRFVADIARAKRFFKLESPDDPLFAMDSVVEFACRELSGSAASFQTMNLHSLRAGFANYDNEVWDRQLLS